MSMTIVAEQPTVQRITRAGPVLSILRALLPAALGLLLLAPAVAAFAASAEIDGELDVVIKETLDLSRVEYDYFIRSDDSEDWQQLELDRTTPGQLHSGQRLRVHGTRNGRKFRVESIDEQGSVVADAAALTGAQTLTAAGTVVDERRTLVLMVDLTNAKASSRYTLSQIAGQMYTNARSVDGLYQAASLGQTRFPADTDGNGAPDVFGPFAINYDNSTCDYYSWASAAEAAAQAAGIDLSRYRHRVFVLPNKTALPACTWAGISNVGCGTFCRAWIAYGEYGMLYAHELGHNLGLAHAGTDPENDSTINNVYGDMSDPMGASSGSWYQFNAAHIDQLGWYAAIPGAVTTVMAGGTYQVAAIGTDPMLSGVPEAIKIAKPNTGDYYYLSYRQPLGNYNQLATTYTQGVNIHRYRGTGANYTSLIKTLTNGASFTDSVNGITITQVATAGGYATLQIGFGCAVGQTSVALSPGILNLRPGASATLAAIVTNQDGANCPATAFTLAYSGPTTGSLTPTALTLGSGQTGNATLSLGTGQLAEGSYKLQLTAADNDGQAPVHSAGLTSATLIVDGTSPSIPTGLTGSSDAKGRISLTWKASADARSGVAGYDVLRNGVVIGQSLTTAYCDAGSVAGTTYTYAVRARDAVGNASATSSPVSMTAAGRQK